MKPCTGILIDPFACTVAPVEYSGDYTDIYTLLSHATMPVSTFEQCGTPILKGSDFIFVDEEGLLKPCGRWFLIDGNRQPLAGKGIVFGSTSAGNTVSPKTPVDTIKMAVTFLHMHGRELTVTTTPWVPE